MNGWGLGIYLLQSLRCILSRCADGYYWPGTDCNGATAQDIDGVPDLAMSSSRMSTPWSWPGQLCPHPLCCLLRCIDVTAPVDSIVPDLTPSWCALHSKSIAQDVDGVQDLAMSSSRMSTPWSWAGQLCPHPMCR